jgi:deoxyadenosine/deoxycytidine kinase
LRGYNNFFFHYDETPLLVVETSDINIVTNPHDLEDLVSVICNARHGTQHYVPQTHA